MAKLHEPGTYKAKIIDYGIWKGKKGPMAVIMFQFVKPSDGSTNSIMWFGSFNGGARSITVDTLVRCGFKGTNAADLNKGKGSGGLDESKDFEIVLQNEDDFKKPGQKQTRVQYVNLPGGQGFKERMDDAEAATVIGGLNLQADFMEARKGRTQKAPVAATETAAPNFNEMEEIPF